MVSSSNRTTHGLTSLKKTIKWFRNFGIRVLDWPAYSLDLNPIENLWRIIKDRLEIMELRTVSEWIAEIDKIWNTFDPHFLTHYIDFMSHRIEKYIEAKGAKINY
jgi:transposase